MTTSSLAVTSGTAMFERVAIVNRGEAAVRLVRAVREVAREQGEDWRVIALHTDPDRHALFVREADEAFPLGSATFVDPDDGRRKNRYLDYAALEAALRASRAEAVGTRTGWRPLMPVTQFSAVKRS